MATVNFCSDGRMYLELTRVERDQALYDVRGGMFLALTPDQVEALVDEAQHALEDREGFAGVH